TYKQLYDSIKPSRVRAKEHSESLVDQLNQKPVQITDLNAQLQEKEIVEQAKSLNLLDNASYYTCKYVKLIHELLGYVRYTYPDIHKPSKKLVAVTPINKKKTVSSMFDARHKLCFLDFVSDMNARSKSKSVKNAKKKEEWKPTGKLTNFVHKFLGTIKFGNDQVAKIMGYGDSQIRNVTISRVYYVKGLGHNLFSVGQFCDPDLEVAFRKYTCFVRNLEGVDLLSGSLGTNPYSLSIGDMMASSPIYLLSKATKTKSWLWHRHLSHLNFGAINHLAKQVHMVKFLASKDEAPDFIIKFLKMIQVRLNTTVQNIRTDNGIDFVNQTLRDYYEEVGISHETSVARTPQ
ncbi:retrovirus-related pol polyprotein from transposon TNT 1-94, partial [Tanacetum coccineum]